MFGLRKKATIKYMEQGVNVTKMVLFVVILKDLAEKYPEHSEEKNGKIAAAAVNEIFKDDNSNFEGNKDVVIQAIKELGRNHPNLKQPITDAMRVYITIQHAHTDKLINDFEKYFRDAIEYGVFNQGGDEPTLEGFTKSVTVLHAKYLQDKQ